MLAALQDRRGASSARSLLNIAADSFAVSELTKNNFASAAANDNAAPTCAQKKRNAARRVSRLADLCFLNEYKSLTELSPGFRPFQPSVSAIVSVSKGVSTSTPTSPSDPLPFFITKTPSPWRYATDEAQGHFAFEALQTLGPVVGFTAWCSSRVSGRAYATGKPLPWLRKRLVEATGAVLGPVEMLVTIEEERGADGTLRLHLHGALSLENVSRRRLARVRQALRRALGTWDGEAAKRQVRFSLDPDCGWASYCTKRAWLATPGIRARFACAQPGSPWRISFDGPVLSMTNRIRAIAKELHERAREAVCEARQRAAAAERPETAPEPAATAHGPVKLALAVRRIVPWGPGSRVARFGAVEAGRAVPSRSRRSVTGASSLGRSRQISGYLRQRGATIWTFPRSSKLPVPPKEVSAD